VVLPGDYNGDGTVDPDDYAVWKSNFGDTSLLTADGNSDGIVNGADYTVWRNNVGASWTDLASGGGSLAGGVPEPTSLALVIAAMGVGGACHRRPRHRRPES
jgi:cytochrome c peroxidase